jgi:hypothetical protein
MWKSGLSLDVEGRRDHLAEMMRRGRSGPAALQHELEIGKLRQPFGDTKRFEAVLEL